MSKKEKLKPHKWDKNWPGAPCVMFYSVYKNPSDYPGMFVCRRYAVVEDDDKVKVEQTCCVATSLRIIREHMPPGLTLLDRDDSDDPKIVECWC